MREETYNGNWIVPSDVSSYYVPELEYNKVGTGKFNASVIVCEGLKEDETLNNNWETRQYVEFVGGELMLYQRYEHQRNIIDTALQIYGKNYTGLFVTEENIYKSNSSYDKDRLTTKILNYYAKGVGLVKQVKIETSSANSGWSFGEEKNWRDSTDKKVTTLELIPNDLDLPAVLFTK
jgi:hypothetical protein